MVPALLAGVALALLAPSPVQAASAATAASGVPTTGTIREGVGAAGVNLGMSKAQVVARWGTPASCSVRSSSEFCSFRSADGVERALVRLTGGPARTVSVITIPFSNPAWSTTRGVHVGSTAYAGTAGTAVGQFDDAYGALVDPNRSTYYSRYVPGVSAGGQLRGSRFTLGWINEYFPDQYFAVTGITVQAG